jgi:hypothetical protein
MQINFSAKKIKEANEYVDLLNPPKIELPKIIKKKKGNLFFKKFFKLLFK